MADEWGAAVDGVLGKPTPGVAEDPYAAAVEGVIGEQKTQIKSNLMGAVRTNPEQAAEARKLSKSTGVPDDVVARNLMDVKFQDAVERAAAKLNQSPRLEQMMLDKIFAGMAHDDVPALADLEARIAQYGEFKAAKGPAPTVWNTVKGLAQSLPQGAELARQGVRQQFADVFGFGDMSKDAERKTANASMGTVLSTPDFESSTAQGLYGGGSSLLRLVPGLAASILTRSPTPALAAAGVQTEAEAYGKYKARGATPGQAFVGAVGEGAVEVATEVMPMGFIVNKFGKVGAGEFVKGLLGREIPSEQVATFVQDAIDTAVANPDKSWEDFLKDRPGAAYQTLLATLVMSGTIGGMSAAAKRMRGDDDKVEAAKQGAEAVTELMTKAKDSKLRERDPEAFADFVQQSADQSGTPDVFIDAQAFAQSLAKLPQAEQEAIAARMPKTIAQLTEAVQTGGDLSMPLGELSLLAGTALEQSITPFVRTDEGAWTQAEAEAFGKESGALLKQQAEQVAAVAETQQQVTAVRDEVLDQLRTAKRFTEETNAAYANSVAAFYTTTAERLGMTPDALFKQYPLRIVAENPAQAGQVLNQGPAEQAIRDTFRAVPSVSLGKPAPITVAFNGRTVQFMARQDKLARGKAESTIHLTTVKRGRLLKGDPEGWVEVGYKLDGKNNLVPEGVPRMLTDEEAARFHAAFPKSGDLAQGEQAPRGTFNPDTNTIALLKGADLSTFLHETGHFYLEVLADLASQPNAPPAIAEDMAKLLDWFGFKGTVEEWKAQPLDTRRDAHEKFARGFEAYLFEGKAPNTELQALFQRFAAWLKQVYKNISALNVELTDEVRGVMNRLLASDEQIAAAEQAAEYQRMFETAEAAGMTPAQFNAYQAQGAKATLEAVEDLERRSLRDMKWLSNAKSRRLKELQAEAKGKRKAISEAVTAEVAAMPIELARDYFKKIKTPTETDYTLAAELFGFTSGDHLKTALAALPPRAEVIEGLTDQRMLENHGELVDPRAIENAANAAVHNEARGRFLAAELRALDEMTNVRERTSAGGSVNVYARAAKQFAASAIGRKKIRDIRPAQFVAAEARAGKQAAISFRKGETVEAATFKRNQVLNHYSARAATEALTEIDKAVAYLKKFDSEGTRKGLDVEYTEQIDDILERYDLRTGQSLAAIDKRKSLADWVKAQQDLGFEPTVDPALIEAAQRTHYRNLALDDFRGIVDTVRNIEHLGRLKKKLLTAKDEREFEQRVDEASASIRDNARRTVSRKYADEGTPLARVKDGFKGVLSMHRKFASLVREMDGFKDGGALWELFVRPMNEAGDREAAMREQATVELTKVFDRITKQNLTRKEFVPEINDSLSREQMLSVALNWGNEANRKRIQQGDGWNDGQVNAILDRLSATEWDFVQAVWDHIDQYWPAIQAKEKRLTGIVPEKVEAAPFEVKIDGQSRIMKGGYYPIKYDPTRSSKAEADTASEIYKQMLGGAYTRATTRRGHTKARVDEVQGRPVRKDFSVAFEHVNQVAHDLSWHEWAIDAQRLLRAKPIDAAIREHYGPETLTELRKAMEDMVTGDVPAQDALERAMNHIRAGTTVAGLGYNLMTSLLQPLGLSQSIVRVGPKWVAKGLTRWLGDAARMENTAAEIHSKSEFMRLRGKTQQRELNEILNVVKGKKLTKLEASYFWMIQTAQAVADIPTWLGAYEKASAEGNDDARSIALADQAVLDSQGGGQIKDLARVQRGGAWSKLWTNFYSFFNVLYNMSAESVNRTDFKDPASVAKLASDYLLLYVVPAAMATLLKAAMTGGGDDEEELVRQLVADQVTYLTGTMVGLREINAGVQGLAGTYSDYSGPAGARFFAEIAKLGKQTAQGEADAAFLKSLNNTAGILLHYPAGQINRTVAGFEAMREGKTENPLALVVGPPK